MEYYVTILSLKRYVKLCNLASITIFLHSRRSLAIAWLCFIPIIFKFPYISSIHLVSCPFPLFLPQQMSQFVSLYFDSTYFQYANPILVEGTLRNSQCPPSVKRLLSPCLFSFSSASFFYGSTYCSYYPPITCSYKRKCTEPKRVYVKKGLGAIWSEDAVAYF